MRGVTLLYTLLACSVAIFGDVNVCSDKENEALLRHEDCNKFYKCTGGQAVEYRCNGDLFFNPETLQCESPQDVNCDGRSIPTDDSRVPILKAARSVQQKTRKPGFLPNGCPETHIHWLLPHETNCSLFYYCVWGDLVLRECPAGTHFNRFIQVCEWPQNANCSTSTSSTTAPTTPQSTTLEPTTSATTKPEFLPNGCPVNPHIHWLLPHETDCTLFYYCVWGELVLRECAPGTHFNSILQVCDWPQNANCSTSTPSTTAPTTPQSTTLEPTTSATTKPEFLPNGCPVNPHIHWLLPHETDCTLFYYCVWGELVLRECAPGTHFNSILQVCDWPQNANCSTWAPSTAAPTTPQSTTLEPTTPQPTDQPTTSEPTTPEITTLAPTTSEPPTTEPTTSATTKPEFLPNGCPVNPHIHWLLPHETDCTLFYYCVWGELVLRECAPGTHFNSILQVCDWPQNANCSTSTPSTTAPTTPQSTTLEPTTSATTKPEFLPNGCPVNPHIHWLLPHETDCTLFYYCVWGELVLRECAPGTHFNSILQVCDWPQNANCSTWTPSTAAPTTPQSTTLEPTTPQPTDQPTTSEPTTPEITTLAPTTSEPPTTEPTTSATTKPEFLPNGCPVNPHIHWLLPHETDCTLFYYCVWGELVLRECAPGTHFNSILQVCDWPQNANCSTSTPSTTAPTTPQSTTLEPTTSATTKPEFLPNGCPVNPHIHWLLPHETDCTLFYYCVWGELVLRECAPGTHFNSILQVCDWPQNANCSTWTPSTAAPTTPQSTTLEPTTPQPTDQPTTSEPTTPEITTLAPTTSEPPTTEPTTSATTKPEFLPNGCPVNPHIHWLLPHETDCTLFYYCVWGELVLRECAPGTHFNSILQVCDWPQNANCSTSTPSTTAPTTPQSTTLEPTTSATTKPEFLPNGCPVNPHIHWLLPHETDCTLFYYCVWGELVLRECAPGTHFNSILQVCDWPQNANCSTWTPSTAAPTTPQSTTLEPTTPQPTDQPTTSEPTTPEITTLAPTTSEPPTTEPTTSATTKPEFLPNGCPVNPHIHWLLPHETDCTLFYYCVWGELVLRECAPGTHFNSILQVCDWPQNANCSTSTPSTTAPTTPQSTTLEPTTSATTKPEFLPNGCPVNPHIHWLLPHETDCTLFYYCVWGELVLRECAPGTHFNSILQVCDWPQNANCSTWTPSTAAPTTPQSTTLEPTTPQPTNQPTTSEPTTPEITTLAPTTSEPPTTEPTTSATTKPEFLPNGCPVNPHIHWLLPHETDCTLFYYCVWGELVLRECAPGTHFNSILQVCDWPQNANCSTSTPSTTAPTTPQSTTLEPTTSATTKPEFLPNGCPVNPHIHWLLPHETDCTLFYYCVWGELVLRECAPGTHFNSILQVCDWPQNANCSTSTSSTTAPTTPQSTTLEPTTSATTKPEFLPNGCPVNPHIHWLLPHETDCTLFYQCVWGNLVLMHCGPGTYFNRTLQVCDWPHNAGCTATLNKHLDGRIALLSL